MKLEKIRDLIMVRKSNRGKGLIWVFIGIFVLLDSPYLFPIPLTGVPSVLLSAVLIAFGARKILNGLELPLYESLLIMEQSGGQIHIDELINALGGPEEVSSDELLQALDKKDWASLASNSLSYVEEKMEDDGEIESGLVLLLPSGKAELKKYTKKIQDGI